MLHAPLLIFPFVFSLSLSHVGYCTFFFFSSRRRHTRSDRDWSSDVCSSDLITIVDSPGGKLEAVDTRFDNAALLDRAGVAVAIHTDDYITDSRFLLRSAAIARSEERRVGKECRSRWSPYH